jgi:adenylylsulfate reductase subunit A
MKLLTAQADFLVIGGGTAGCAAALAYARTGTVLVAEKANIKRSGCLAAGVNALNAYIGPGKTPEDYAEYAMRDAKGIARRDLLLSMSRGLNKAASEMEKLGLTILREDGKAAMRGDRNVKINGRTSSRYWRLGFLRKKE